MENYKLKLQCANCYNTFEQEFPRGFEAMERGILGHTAVRDVKGKEIECPNCGCTTIRKVRP